MGKDWDNPNTFPLRDRGERLTGSGNPTVSRGFANGITLDSSAKGRDTFISFLTSIMSEALRCLKPGGHAFVWALPRTSHWTATALENAGFEVRDCITHLLGTDTLTANFVNSLNAEQYAALEAILESQDEPSVLAHLFGSGFPKSCNISLAIDKHFKAEREVIGYQKAVGNARGKGAAGHYANGIPSLTGEGYEIVKDGWDITAPATPEATTWTGWHTALKPSQEMWWLCRKPLAEKTIAENVLHYGTGAINVDACRIGVAQDEPNKRRATGEQGGALSIFGVGNHARPATLTQGRFPSNTLLSHTLFCHDGVCHEGCPVKALDEMSGIRNSHGNSSKSTFKGVFGNGKPVTGPVSLEDKGTASRYFQQLSPDVPFIYAPKASRKDRSSHGAVENTHPTVKSTTLISYLSKMICPENGVILDMFAGSGTLGVCAIQNGFHYILVEQDAEYVEIARKRIAQAYRDMGVCQ